MNWKLSYLLLFLILFISKEGVSQNECFRVKWHQKISDTRGYFNGTLDNLDRFGRSATSIGDLDGDGFNDLVVGAINDDDGGSNRGAVWVLFLDSSGNVKNEQKISTLAGGFTGSVSNRDLFGTSTCNLGDLDGDGVNDIAVGAIWDDDGGTDRGAVYILFLNTDGTVKSNQKISDFSGSFTGALNNGDNFGSAVTAVGDLNGDSITELVVGTFKDDDGGTDRGALWVLFLNTDGTVQSHQKISSTTGGLIGPLNNSDFFGVGAAALNDMNGDSIPDIVVGAHGDDDGGVDRGSAYILFLDTNGTVKGEQKISSSAGNFSGTLVNNSIFGLAVGSLGDINADGVPDIVIASERDADGGINNGAIWVLLMDTSTTVKQSIKISELEGNFVGDLSADLFGHALGGLGDFNHDGFIDVVVGAYEDDGGNDHGGVWILSLEICPDSCVAGNQSTFQKVYKFNGNDEAHSVQETFDEGFIVVGETANIGNQDWFSIKTNKDGDTLWTKTFGSNAVETGVQVVVKQTADSGFVITGRTFGFGTVASGIYLLKLDQFGNIEWEKTIDGNASEHGRNVEQTADGGYIIVATNGYIIRLNADGSMRWNKYYSGGVNMHFTGVKETPTHEFIIAGSSQYGLGARSAYLLKIDSLGNRLWENVFDDSFADAFIRVEVTDDQGYILMGYTSSSSVASSWDALLLKTDSSGRVEWNRVYSSGSQEDIGMSLVVTNDNGYVISVFTDNFGADHNLIIKTDNHGNTEWAKVYPGKISYGGDNIQPTKDGGYVSANFSSTFGNSDDVHLIKMNSCGESGCHERVVTLDVTEKDFNLITPTSSITAYGTVSNITSNTGPFSVQDTTLCEFDPLCQLSTNFMADTVCLGDTTRFTDLSTDALANVTGWKWYFGDGDSLIGTENAVHQYADSGTYMVKLVVFNDDTTFCADSITIPVRVVAYPLVNLGNDTSICYGNNILLNAFTDGATYMWQDNSTNATFNADTTGFYYVEVDELGCASSDSIELTFPLPPNLSLGADTALCIGDSITVDATTPSVSYLWQDNTTDSTYLVKNTGTYWVEINTGVCMVRDSIDITFENQPIVELGSDTIICEGEVLQLDAFNSGSTYLWSDNSFDTTLDVSSAGLYWVSVTSALGACNTRDSITVNYDTIPLLSLGSDTILCDGDSMLLDATIPLVTYLWQDNTTDSIHLVKTSGTYWVEVNTGVCITRDSIDLLFESEITVDFGPDTILCEGSDLVLNATNNGSTYFWQDGSVLSSLTISDSGFYWVTVTSSFGSCVVSDSIHVDYDPIPSVNLGNDTSLCEGDSILLNASFPGASYLWNDGSTSPNLWVTSEGRYVVDLSLGNCISQEAIVVLFDSLPVFDLGPNRTICENDSIQIKLKNNWEMYQWSNGDSTATVFFNSAGMYHVKVINGACVATDTIQLRVNPLPNGLEQQRYILCEENTITIDAGNPGSSYLWSSGETTQTIVVSNAGRYDVTITTKDGCSLTDVFAVERCTTNIFIPNTITPNGDGKNDSWIIRNIDAFPGNTVQIFNRNGYLLFETTNYQNDWSGMHEGRELPAGVYYYVLDLKGNGGLHKGTLTILQQK